MEALVMTYIEIPLRLLSFLWLVESVALAMTLIHTLAALVGENILREMVSFPALSYDNIPIE